MDRSAGSFPFSLAGVGLSSGGIPTGALGAPGGWSPAAMNMTLEQIKLWLVLKILEGMPQSSRLPDLQSRNPWEDIEQRIEADPSSRQDPEWQPKESFSSQRVGRPTSSEQPQARGSATRPHEATFQSSEPSKSAQPLTTPSSRHQHGDSSGRYASSEQRGSPGEAHARQETSESPRGGSFKASAKEVESRFLEHGKEERGQHPSPVKSSPSSDGLPPPKNRLPQEVDFDPPHLSQGLPAPPRSSASAQTHQKSALGGSAESAYGTKSSDAGEAHLSQSKADSRASEWERKAELRALKNGGNERLEQSSTLPRSSSSAEPYAGEQPSIRKEESEAVRQKAGEISSQQADALPHPPERRTKLLADDPFGRAFEARPKEAEVMQGNSGRPQNASQQQHPRHHDPIWRPDIAPTPMKMEQDTQQGGGDRLHRPVPSQEPSLGAMQQTGQAAAARQRSQQQDPRGGQGGGSTVWFFWLVVIALLGLTSGALWWLLAMI